MAIKKSKKGWILRSAIEHDSVRFANSEAEIIPVDGDGVLKLGALKEALSGSSRGEDALVSVMFSNNETGVIQPIDNVVAIAHEVGALVHCDAVQAFGKIPFQFSKLGVDSLAISAHKMGGPTGVGALIVSEKMEMSPFLEGGGQERRRRAGTENVLGIVGFSAALETIHQDDWSRIEQLRNQLERRILNVTSEAEIYGQRAPRAPNTSCIRMPGLSSEKQIIAFDMEGIAVSAGSACSSGKVAESHVLNAMGVNASEAIRVSLGWGSQSEDINSFVTVWEKLYRQFRDKK
jgi:cysteine desulfurase